MKESASLKKYRLLLRDLPTVHVQDVTHVSLQFFLIFDYNIVLFTVYILWSELLNTKVVSF